MLALLEDPQRSTLIKQGAEAKVYISEVFPTSRLTHLEGALLSDHSSTSSFVSPSTALFKYRFPKTYRHPSLSTHLTATRTTAEARALLRCAKADVNTPKVVCVDELQGILGLELIPGHSIRELLGGGSEGEEVEDSESAQGMLQDDQLLDEEGSIRAMRLIGVQVAKMHQAHVIHGDLTTSNMMLRDQKGKDESEVVLIDFGLSSNSTWPEDKAVDLYVLERAFQSTHPSSEHLFDEIIESYKQTLLAAQMSQGKGDKGNRPAAKLDRGVIPGPTLWNDISRKLDDVRLRGRKRSMVG